MSKKYRGKTCVYCGEPKSSTTADHVIAREFFLPNQRANLPKVPACKQCNGAKSILEHYLTTVIPFGGRHAASNEVLETQVRTRLQNNLALARQLHDGATPIFTSDNGRDWGPDGGRLPFDIQKLLDLCVYITKGLAFHHWILLHPDATHLVYAACVNNAGVSLMESQLVGHPEVTGNFGEGIFTYRARLSPDLYSVWSMSIAGVQLTGDPNHPGLRTSRVYVVAAPRTDTLAQALALRMEAR